MPQSSRQLLTYSRIESFNKCRHQDYYAYEAGIRKTHEAKALRMGSGAHLGLNLRARGKGQDNAVKVIRESYAEVPEWALEFLDDWLTECEIVVALICGYYWVYQNDDIEILDTEKSFRMRLRNPDGNRPSTIFDLAGKRDLRIRLADRRIALMEYKTTGEDISPTADYWSRLRIDQQISLYCLAERPDTIIYDVIRKPSISRLLATPEGKRKYRQDGKLYAQQRFKDESPEEFGIRLLADITKRPEFYYARREIPRLDSDIKDFECELWQIQQAIRHCQLNGHWFRHVSQYTCPYCQFKDLCYAGVYPIDDKTPMGFIRLDNVHPELDFEENSYDSANDSENTTTATTTTSATEGAHGKEATSAK